MSCPGFAGNNIIADLGESIFRMDLMLIFAFIEDEVDTKVGYE